MGDLNVALPFHRISSPSTAKLIKPACRHVCAICMHTALQDIKEEVMRDFTNVMKMDLDTRGVIVQASTLGALEALMQFLRKECDPPIPVSAVNIGPIYK